MKNFFLFVLILTGLGAYSQEESGSREFWNKLQSHCGKAFKGELIGEAQNDAFAGKELVMHIRTCSEDRITIPFFVGDDRSRTWILTYDNERIRLKHDHRKADGSEDRITQYGGTSPNVGVANIQFFPADSETADLIPLAATNVWWLTLDENTFSYNLKRMGTENPEFKVVFDLTNPIPAPEAPWGWEK